MKVFILFAVVCSVSCQLQFSPEEIQVIMQHNPDCQKESNAQESMIVGAIKGEFVDDPALKKHLLCLGKKLNYINDDGKFNEDVVRKQMSLAVSDSARIDDLITKCLVEKDTPEETAYQSIKCMSDNFK